MHKIRALCLLIRTETLKKATAGRRRERLRQNLLRSYARCCKHIETIAKNPDPLVITQRGRAAAVIIGLEAYEKSEHDKELLRLLAKGDKEVEIGEGYDLDSVFAEADLLLDKGQ